MQLDLIVTWEASPVVVFTQAINIDIYTENIALGQVWMKSSKNTRTLTNNWDYFLGLIITTMVAVLKKDISRQFYKEQISFKDV